MSTPAENVTPDNPALPPEAASEVVTTPLPRGAPRQGMADLIAAQRREQQAREIGATVEELSADASPPESAGGEEEQEDADEAQEDSGPEEEEAALPQADEPGDEAGHDALTADEAEMVRISVFAGDADGFEGWVPSAEVVAAGGEKPYAQRLAAKIKNSRAEQKHAMVEAREAELSRREQALAAEEQRRREAAPVQRQPLGADAEAELAAMAEEYPDEVVDTRRRVLEMERRAGQAPVDAQAIAAQVLQITAEQQRVASQEKADKWFSEHYSHIEGDENLRAIAELHARKMLQANPQADPFEVVKAAGEHTDQWLSRNEPRPSAEAEKRVERKRQLPGQPVARGVRHAPAPEPPPKTPSNVIAEMAKARGQGK